MHARAGTRDGVMNHTISGRDFQNLWFNDTLVGETGINAALCGTWGCPVLLVTGDEASCREGERASRRRAHDRRGEVRARRRVQRAGLTPVARPRADRGAARSARSPISTAVAPYDPGRPCEIKVEFKNTSEPDALRFRHGVERIDDRTIVSRADTWWEAWKQFYF